MKLSKKQMIIIGAALAAVIIAIVAIVALSGGNGMVKGADAEKVAELKKQYADAEVGDYITFGAYEQDNNQENGKEPVEWLVLAKEGDRLLITSKEALDFKPYNDTQVDITWEKCTLRKWLNEDFLKAAFSKEEQSLIPTVKVANEDNYDKGTKGGNSTKDKVFLLSAGEANRYFYSDDSRMLEATSYAKVQGDWSWNRRNQGYCWWWLRGPGGEQDVARGCNEEGETHVYGANVDGVYAVRPALWIDLAP